MIRIILLLLISTPVLAEEPYEVFITKFIENYNSKNFAANYDLYAEGSKGIVMAEYFEQILGSNFLKAGKINTYLIVENSERRRVYFLECERKSFTLSVSLDNSGKATGLYVNPVDQPTDQSSWAQIDRWQSSETNAGLVICRIVNGKPDIHFFGTANREEPSVSVGANSIFEIGSISKPLTGILLHFLIAEGKISLEDPINKFLPKEGHLPKVKGKDVLIRNLIVHGSCLPRMPGNLNPPPNEMNNPHKYYGVKDLLAFLPTVTTGDCELNASPTYSNLGAGLLGYILTKVSGQSYKDLFETRIARPLHTKSLGIMGPSAQWAHGHVSDGGLQPQFDFTDALVGGGGVDASAEDMTKLLTFLMSPDQSPLGKAVSASTVVQLQGSQGAVGTFWGEDSDGIIQHNGKTGGFNAFLGWKKGTKNGVFILVNTGVDVATPMGFAMLREMK